MVVHVATAQEANAPALYRECSALAFAAQNRAGEPGFGGLNWLLPVPSVSLEANCLVSLCLSFLICKVIVLTSKARRVLRVNTEPDKQQGLRA